MTEQGVEEDRIAFLVRRDGVDRARAWALDIARTYRLVVLKRHARWRKPLEKPKLTLYRRPLIRSYLALKRFAGEYVLPDQSPPQVVIRYAIDAETMDSPTVVVPKWR